MNINRNNYEEFFLLYADNELTAEERTMVEQFIVLHPDLGEELNILSQTKLPHEEHLAYTDKANLFRHSETNFINEDNYKEYFLLYVDEELNVGEKKAVEEFVSSNNDKQNELLLFQQVKLQAEEDIVFRNKDTLYRTEKQPIRIIPMRWISVAAAAAVILTGIAVWTTSNEEETIHENNSSSVIAEAGSGSIKENASIQAQGSHQDIKPSNQEVVQKLETVTSNTYKNTDQTNEGSVVVREAINNSEPVAKDFQKDQIEVGKHLTRVAVISTNNQVVESIHNAPNTAAASKQQLASNNEISPNRFVKPLILDEAAFNGENKIQNENQADKNNGQIVFFDTDNIDKKPKGKLRGLFRKASRILDHATNAGEANDQSVVRIASFEIAKK